MWTREENHLPQPDGHGQGMVGFLGYQCALPQVLLGRTSLSAFSAQSVFVLGFVPKWIKGFALGLAELHKVCMGQPLKHLNIPLDGTVLTSGVPSLQSVNCSTN